MELDVLNGGKLFINKFRPIMWIENQRVFPNKLNKLLLKSGYALYWVLSYLFNPHNHNKSNINYFPNICQENILQFQKKKVKTSTPMVLIRSKMKQHHPKKMHTCMI